MVDTHLLCVEAGPRSGLGHLVRCTALADSLTRYGVDAVLATRTPLQVAGSRGAPRLIDADLSDPSVIGRLSDDLDAKVVVLDGYSFEAEHQRAAAGRTVVCLDDYRQLESHQVDVILDQNAGTDEELYRDTGAKLLLLGSEFVLLRRDFLRYGAWMRDHPQRVRRALVCVGGSDPQRLSKRIVEDLAGAADWLDEVNLVLGPLAPPLEIASLPFGVNLHRDPQSMADLMAENDFAICASGSVVWECAYMQLPTLVFSLAANQEPLAAAASRCGFAISLSRAQDVSTSSIAMGLDRLDRATRASMGRLGRALIDGYGSERVAARLTGNDVWLRDAHPGDETQLLSWANDPEVRAASFDRPEIDARQHATWFREKLSDPQTRLFVAHDLYDAPVGQVRFDLDGSHATCHVSIGSQHRDRGLGARLISLACDRLFAETDTRTVVALVMARNPRSQRVFERAGFIRRADENSLDSRAITYELHGPPPSLR